MRKTLIKIMLNQLKDGAIDDLSYTKTLNKKELKLLAIQYAKDFIKGE
jgi:hypothetical protein